MQNLIFNFGQKGGNFYLKIAMQRYKRLTKSQDQI
jgi:hypothetical protein